MIIQLSFCFTKFRNFNRDNPEIKRVRYAGLALSQLIISILPVYVWSVTDMTSGPGAISVVAV